MKTAAEVDEWLAVQLDLIKNPESDWVREIRERVLVEPFLVGWVNGDNELVSEVFKTLNEAVGCLKRPGAGMFSSLTSSGNALWNLLTIRLRPSSALSKRAP